MTRRFLLFLIAFAGSQSLFGCSVVDVRAQVDPSSREALTDSLACIYEFDRQGLWYVAFVRKEGLLATVHRHHPGIHLFLDDQANLAFFARCSGRAEVLDLDGKTFDLSKGAVFLADADDGSNHVNQLQLSLPPCSPADPPSISKAVYQLSQAGAVAPFIGPESQARLRAKWQIEKDPQPHGDPSQASK